MDGSGYKNSRQLTASLVLVPKDYSSGGKQSSSGITKRGNPYI
ncbi:transposase [Shewanella sp. YIC-542]